MISYQVQRPRGREPRKEVLSTQSLCNQQNSCLASKAIFQPIGCSKVEDLVIYMMGRTDRQESVGHAQEGTGRRVNVHSIDELVERSDVAVHFFGNIVSLPIEAGHGGIDGPTVQPFDGVLVHNGVHPRQRARHVANCPCGVIGGRRNAVPHIEGLRVQLPIAKEHRNDDSSAFAATQSNVVGSVFVFQKSYKLKPSHLLHE